MRILYGVHGYGRGHATRSLAILEDLVKQHQVLVLAGGDAYAAMSSNYHVVRIPTLGFAYGARSGQRSNWQTFRRNFSAIIDLCWCGPVCDMVADQFAEFGPDVVISDAEPFTHHVAARLKVPRIGIDHIGILAHCRPVIEWRDRLEAAFDSAAYRLLVGNPDRVIVSSFYDAVPRRPGVCVVGTMPRHELFTQTPRDEGFLLAYFNKGKHQLSSRVCNTLSSCGLPVRIYGTDTIGRQGALDFRPLSSLPFLEDLAGCRAVISTAGNQLMGEALYMNKPVLVMPERCVEQRMNALAVERMGIGMRLSLRRSNPAALRRFLDRAGEFAARTRGQFRDGRSQALAAIERFMQELVPTARVAPSTHRDSAPSQTSLTDERSAR
ncbi:MAG: hypothetical protein EHM42_02360 [Planctomycetaceae bacterium]|nr:MAG: hypothetical protein EHM42_02360 [Planctomycetaceae bacterium]